jgi:hypothetical protein
MDSEGLNRWQKTLKENIKLQKALTKDFQSYLAGVAELGEIKKNILAIEQQQKAIELEKQEIVRQISNSQGNEKINLEAKLKILEDISDEIDSQLTSSKKTAEQYRKQVKSVDKLVLGWNSISKSARKLPAAMEDGFGKLKTYGIFELDKEIKNASKSLNLASTQNKKFGKTLTSAVRTTGEWGVSAKDLAKAQRGYSEEIGRSLMLTKDSSIAMGEMAAGTNMGIDGVTSLVGEMDKFGISIEGTRDLIEESVKLSATMGVNSDKAISNLQKNLKLSQRYNFKGGVKGLVKMANEAAYLKINMDSMAGMADKVFRPEGAIEMAAKLQVMGGEFAKLGDAQTLMFKARNDFAGFTKDIAKATSEFVSFNSESGTYEVNGGLARDRMREIAETTGIAVEELQEMATQQKKLSDFKGKISSSFSEEDRLMIANLSEVKNGELMVTLGGNDPLNVKELTETQLTNYKNQTQLLKDRAKRAQTFDDQLEAFKNNFKNTLLPMVTSLSEGFGASLSKLTQSFDKGGFYKKLEVFAESAGDLISAFATFGTKTIGGIYDIFGAKGIFASLAIFKLAPWLLKGRTLAMGFNQVASVGGSGGSGFGSMGRTAANTVKGRGLSGHMGKFGKSMARGGMMKGAGIGLAGMGVDYLRDNVMDDPESTGGKAMGVASKALAWGGTGAMIGSVIPGIGTAAGAAIGGIAGAISGYMDEFGDDVESETGKVSDGEIKPNAKLNDGIIQFNNNDKFMNVGSDTMIAGTNVNGNKDLAKSMSGGNSVMKHNFDDININININANGNMASNIGDELTKDRAFLKNLSIKINEEIRMAIGGGKLSPNPV